MSKSIHHLEWEYLRRHKVLFTGVLLCRAVWEIIPMQVPVLAGALVDGVAGKSFRVYGVHWSEATPRDAVSAAAIGLLLVALLYGLSAYAYTVLGARLDKRFVAGLRKAVAEKAILLSLDHHQRLGSGELMDCVLRDTGRLRGYTERVFTRSLTNAVRAGFPIVMLLLIDARLALIALSVIPPQWFLTWRLQRRLQQVTRLRQADHSELTTAIKENLDAIETIQALDAAKPAVARVQGWADRVEAGELETSRISALIRANVWTLTGIGLALTWWRGGLGVLDGVMTVGTLVAFTGFVDYAYRPFRHFTTIVKKYRDGTVSLERIRDILALPSSVEVRPDARPIPVKDGVLEFRRVCFSYDARAVLQGLDLRIEGKRITAILGRSGSGKSSMLRLVARLYDPTSGDITLDGHRLSSFTLESLRSQVAVVPQHPAIFSGTILENLRIARPDAPIEAIEQACESAGALEFIDRLDGRFEARIGRGAGGLSGGQLQRLSIARALLKDPKVLLMDEPTSALDAESEELVLETLRRLRGTMTIVVVTHRPSTAAIADRVLLMDLGRVVAERSPDEMLLHPETGDVSSPIGLFARTVAT